MPLPEVLDPGGFCARGNFDSRGGKSGQGRGHPGQAGLVLGDGLVRHVFTCGRKHSNHLCFSIVMSVASAVRAALDVQNVVFPMVLAKGRCPADFRRRWIELLLPSVRGLGSTERRTRLLRRRLCHNVWGIGRCDLRVQALCQFLQQGADLLEHHRDGSRQVLAVCPRDSFLTGHQEQKKNLCRLLKQRCHRWRTGSERMWLWQGSEVVGADVQRRIASGRGDAHRGMVGEADGRMGIDPHAAAHGRALDGHRRRIRSRDGRLSRTHRHPRRRRSAGRAATGAWMGAPGWASRWRYRGILRRIRGGTGLCVWCAAIGWGRVGPSGRGGGAGWCCIVSTGRGGVSGCAGRGGISGCAGGIGRRICCVRVCGRIRWDVFASGCGVRWRTASFGISGCRILGPCGIAGMLGRRRFSGGRLSSRRLRRASPVGASHGTGFGAWGRVLARRGLAVRIGACIGNPARDGGSRRPGFGWAVVCGVFGVAGVRRIRVGAVVGWLKRNRIFGQQVRFFAAARLFRDARLQICRWLGLRRRTGGLGAGTSPQRMGSARQTGHITIKAVRFGRLFVWSFCGDSGCVSVDEKVRERLVGR